MEEKEPPKKIDVRLAPEGSGKIKVKVVDHRVTPMIGWGLVMAALGALFLFVNLLGIVFTLVHRQGLDPSAEEDAAAYATDQGYFTAYLVMGIIAFVILLVGMVLIGLGGYRRNQAAKASVHIK
jgi:amino acid transporter